MNPLGIKLLAGLGTVGVLSVGSYGIYSLTDTSDSVENYLKKKGFTITEQTDAKTWEKVLATYRLEKVGFEIDTEEISIPNQIEKWCSKNLSKKINSTKDHLFKQASKWCVNYTTIKEQLGEGAKLEEKAETLEAKHKNFPVKMQEEIKEIVLSSEASTNVNGLKTIEWCKKNIVRSYSNNSEFYFENIKQHCLAAVA